MPELQVRTNRVIKYSTHYYEGRGRRRGSRALERLFFLDFFAPDIFRLPSCRCHSFFAHIPAVSIVIHVLAEGHSSLLMVVMSR
jgi:hypothetical protein